MGILSSLLRDFDITKLLPEMDTFLGQLRFWLGLFVTIGPLVMLALGLLYFFKPTGSRHSLFGYRSYYTSGSDAAWRFAQRIAGMCWIAVGGGLFVIMLIISLLYGLMDPLKMAITTLVCVCGELLLVIASQVFIHRQVLKYFDKDGNPL